MANPPVKFLIFDIESVSDGRLISKVRYPGEALSPADAIKRYRSELMEKQNSDFIPYTFQVPISVIAAKIDEKYQLMDIVALDQPHYRPHIMVEHFWRGWELYKRPTLVSFNGRTFDLPLLELAAYRFGISLPHWFNLQAKAYDQYRNRYNLGAHLDLQDVLTNFSATRFNGGLNLAASLVGKPGKMAVQGFMVQDLYDEGKLQAINDYCRCDVLDTYFVFLRSAVLMGWLTLEKEQLVVDHAREWLASRAGETPIYAEYLNQWQDWENPWTESSAE
jgi:3'-5' exonuclease